MSRHSRITPRESVFGAGPELYRREIQTICPPNLAECVVALEDCCEEAYEAQQLLRNGTHDLPRLKKVLENQRVFLLVDEGTVKRYKGDLAEEAEPQITELLNRAEQGLEILMKKEIQLKTKLDSAKLRPPRPTAGTTAAQKLEARRHQMVVKQRERLEEERKALKTEVETLERQIVEERDE